MFTRQSTIADTGDPAPSDVSWRPWLLAVIGGLVIAAASVAIFGASGRDDPYITFSAAESVRDAGALVNINGDVIEQSTTLLLTLLLAVLSAILPVAVPELGWLAGLLSLAGIVVVSFALLRLTLPPTRALLGAYVVGLTPPLIYWSASGAEQSLGILLTLLSIMVVSRRVTSNSPMWPSLLAAVLTWLTFLARPDMGLAVIGATVLLLLWRVLTRRRHGLALLVITVAAQTALVGVSTATRLALTGSPLPQPLSAKVGGDVVAQALRGLDYLASNAASWWFIVVIVAGALAAWATRGLPWNETQVLLIFTAMILIAGGVLSGGDWMELGRFFAAPATLLTVVAAGLIGRIPTRAFALTIGIVAGAQIVTIAVWSQSPTQFESRGSSVFSRWELNAIGSPGVPNELDTAFNRWNADHLGDAYFLGAAVPAIAEIVAKDPDRVLTVTSGQGGMIPYYLRREFGDRIRFIDRFQLMTDDFEGCDLAPGPYGAFISWNQWADLAGTCAPPLPDMAFSIGPVPYDDLGEDYEVVVHVEGTADRNGQSLPQEQWLAVRTELLSDG